MDNINVALDIGTHKVACLVAQKSVSGEVNILGLGLAESEGLNRGVVVNIEKTVKTLKKVIQQAQDQSGIEIKKVTVGIAGDHIEALQTRCLVGISGESPEISQPDLERLTEEARKLPITPDRTILHVMASEYIIDGQDGITDPIGMSGARLEGIIHVITAMKSAVSNIERCVERAGLQTADIVLEPIACSRAVLSEEEKEVGVAIVDIGGGTTDIAVFQNNVLRFTSVFALAGQHVTEDIKEVLKIVTQKAEKVKKEHGHCYGPTIMNDELFMIPGVAGREPIEVTKSYLCEIIEPRMEELFGFAGQEIIRSNYANRLGAGIVLTGGTCLLKGTQELAHSVFGVAVKLGIPTGITYNGLGPEVESPVYATGVGLLLWAFEQDELNGRVSEAKQLGTNEEEPTTQVNAIEAEHSQPKVKWSSYLKNPLKKSSANKPEGNTDNSLSKEDLELRTKKNDGKGNLKNLPKKIKDFVERL